MGPDADRDGVLLRGLLHRLAHPYLFDLTSDCIEIARKALCPHRVENDPIHCIAGGGNWSNVAKMVSAQRMGVEGVSAVPSC